MNKDIIKCDGNCSVCSSAEALRRPSNRPIRLAVVPVQGSDAHSLLDSLIKSAGDAQNSSCALDAFVCEGAIPYDADVVLQQVDAMDLRGGLMQTTFSMDSGLRMVLYLDNYASLLSTGHSVDCETLSNIIGFPVVTSVQGADRLVSAVRSIHEDALWLPKIIQGRTVDEEEHARIGFVSGALQETLRHSGDNSDHSLAQKVDALLTNKWLGLPLLILVLFLVFSCTFTLGAYPQQWIASGIDSLAAWISNALAPGWFASMLVDGIVQGVGAVLAFLPNIIILFFFLSVLEDCGYMARAAYIMDKIMHRIGLHGNSFIPMLIGFGCNVPAIMAARNIHNRKDRVLTMLMIPFMSCSARLPVYLLLVSAFFPKGKAIVMISLYILGIVLSILFAFVMKRTRWFRKGNEDYVSELPPFHLPRLKATASHIWERVSDYLQKISTVILAASVIIWALEYFPMTDGQPAPSDESCLAAIGRAMEPVMSPLGFDWKMNVCILTGLPAKEAIVSTLGILYHTEDEGFLVGALRASEVFTPSTALAFMVFVLLYFPCIATIATLKRETGRKWTLFIVLFSMVLAWVAAFAVRLFSSLL